MLVLYKTKTNRYTIKHMKKRQIVGVTQSSENIFLYLECIFPHCYEDHI